MGLKVPRLRLRLRTLAALVAVLTVSLWAGLSIWSPTRRLGRLLMADQPVFVRREAASSLGRAIPPREVDQAVSLLIRALDDPSPREREYAGVRPAMHVLGRPVHAELTPIIHAKEELLFLPAVIFFDIHLTMPSGTDGIRPRANERPSPASLRSPG